LQHQHTVADDRRKPRTVSGVESEETLREADG
jgi:hypothetical protein